LALGISLSDYGRPLAARQARTTPRHVTAGFDSLIVLFAGKEEASYDTIWARSKPWIVV
jgi:hypothetical protein